MHIQYNKNSLIHFYNSILIGKSFKFRNKNSFILFDATYGQDLNIYEITKKISFGGGIETKPNKFIILEMNYEHLNSFYNKKERLVESALQPELFYFRTTFINKINEKMSLFNSFSKAIINDKSHVNNSIIFGFILEI